jgi:translation elongation factor EF-Tu-like GTPase
MLSDPQTVIGGAQIIDLMILVIDVVKGIQAQTAECLAIGEITNDNMIVVLNKVDMLPEADRASQLQKAETRIRCVLVVADAPPSLTPRVVHNTENSFRRRCLRTRRSLACLHVLEAKRWLQLEASIHQLSTT